MPDSALSNAIKEAYAIAPTSSVIYYTLEIWHSAFDEPIRVVNAKRSIDARLESGAPRDAGAIVTFTALAFELIPPNVDTAALPTCTIRIDNVDRQIGRALDTAVIAGGKISVIFRQFLSDSLSAGPEIDFEMTMIAVSLDAFKVTAQCGFPDLLNRNFPNLDYNLDEFPGLAQ